jgi:hypothetical protein
MTLLGNSKEPIEVFYSYSHKDEALRKELDKHLSLLKRKRIITGWHDRRISAGRHLDREIRLKLMSAGIILLLISPDFMASDYCYKIELKLAMQRHKEKQARVVPIILRPTDWKASLFGKLLALPTDGEPITSRKWTSRDQAFQNVVAGIRQIIDERPQSRAIRRRVPVGDASIEFFVSRRNKLRFRKWERDAWEQLVNKLLPEFLKHTSSPSEVEWFLSEYGVFAVKSILLKIISDSGLRARFTTDQLDGVVRELEVVLVLHYLAYDLRVKKSRQEVVMDVGDHALETYAIQMRKSRRSKK